MQFTNSLLKCKGWIWQRHHQLLKNDRLQYKEFVPLKSTNYVMSNQQTRTGESCTKELQALFECLRKWEFDNLPCADLNNAFLGCVERLQKARKHLAEKADEVVNNTGKSSSLSVPQMNKLMAQHPQPQLGKYPYKALKRLPNQSYADDIFSRKNKKGKSS